MNFVKLRKYDYDLELGNCLYESLKQANLLNKDGYKPYFDYKGIKHSAEFNTKVKRAKCKYVENYLKQAAFYARDKVKWIKKLAQITLERSKQSRGATIFPGTGISVKGGYVVGGVADTVSVNNLTYEELLDYINSHYEYLNKDNYMIGTWYDSINKHWDIDVSEVVFNEKEAQSIASTRKEKAYFDLYQFVSKNPDGSIYDK